MYWESVLDANIELALACALDAAGAADLRTLQFAPFAIACACAADLDESFDRTNKQCT